MSTHNLRRRLLEEAEEVLPEKEKDVLRNNIDFLFDNFDVEPLMPTSFDSMIGFDPVFSMLTNSFRNFSPLYDNHFDFLSSANNRLSKPYPESTIHIYVQNSIANDGGAEIETAEFECGDGFPLDLFQSCHELKKKVEPEPEPEPKPVVIEENNSDEDFIPSFLDGLIGLFGGAEIEEEKPAENDPALTDSGVEPLIDSGIEQEEAEPLKDEETAEFPSPFDSLFESMGCMFGMDDEPSPMHEEIHPTPFHNLFDFFNIFDDGETVKPQDSQDEVHVNVFRPFPMRSMPLERSRDWEPEQEPHFIHLNLLGSEPTISTYMPTTSVESESFGFNFEQGMNLSEGLVNNRLLEGTILGSLILVLMFFGFRQGWCKQSVSSTVSENPEEIITTEEAKAQASTLPDELQVNLIESEDELDRPITPDDLTEYVSIEDGDGI